MNKGERKNKQYMNQLEKKPNKITESAKKPSILTWNVYGLNSPIKDTDQLIGVQNQNPSICCQQAIHLSAKDIRILKMKGRKMTYK
jgi:hypothetical protein